MKKYSLFFLCLFSPLVLAFSQNDLVALLQKNTSQQGEFTQQRFLKSLDKPITTGGRFVLLTKKGLLWQMKKPFVNNLLVKPSGIMQWNGQSWVANENVAQSQQVGLFLGLLSGDISAIESQFSLNLTGTEENWTLQLMPSSLLMKQIFDSIKIRGGETVKEIELNEKQGDRTLIRFDQIEINQPLDDFSQSALN